jgi:predicted DNA-binding transcriptional regulator
MNNKKILKDAIETSGRYSANHIKVFSTLVDCAVDDKVFLPVKEIQKKTNMKRSSVYFALNNFQKDGLLVQDKTQMGAFVFQQDKIDFLISLYKKKQSI